jgi:hypothetical protein
MWSGNELPTYGVRNYRPMEYALPTYEVLAGDLRGTDRRRMKYATTDL